MEREARVTIERIIKKLNELAGPTANEFVRMVDETDWDDERAWQKLEALMQIHLSIRQGIFQAVSRVLAGENIFTPSLLNRGWTFWRKPLLDPKEKETIASAHLRFCQFSDILLELAAEMGRTQHDHRRVMSIFARALDSIDSSFQRLSADLKKILTCSEA